MSPRDPRLMSLMSRAYEWQRSVYYLDDFEDPEWIDLEIIPPTSGQEPVDPRLPLVMPSKRDSAQQCQALLRLADALIAALRGPERATA